LCADFDGEAKSVIDNGNNNFTVNTTSTIYDFTYDGVENSYANELMHDENGNFSQLIQYSTSNSQQEYMLASRNNLLSSTDKSIWDEAVTNIGSADHPINSVARID